MPRKPRFQLPGIPQHIIQRGNNREPCFYAEPDYQRYLEALGDALQRNRCELHAYVLMTNHVHLLMTPQVEYGISHTMQDTGRKYVQYINKTYQRTGTLWEGRYKASLVDSEAYLLACMRYIELNPVRAGMVKHPSYYRWSSYLTNANGKNNALIHPHAQYLQLGRDEEKRLFAYRELFNNCLDATLLHELRASLNQELVLGREDFKNKVGKMTQRRVRRGKDGPPRVEDICSEYDVAE
jgi:putative transposase